jgi:hypothetical protein
MASGSEGEVDRRAIYRHLSSTLKDFFQVPFESVDPWASVDEPKAAPTPSPGLEAIERAVVTPFDENRLDVYSELFAINSITHSTTSAR